MSVSDLYDPFNIDRNCLRFIAWQEPTPNTDTLVLYEKDSVLRVTTDPSDRKPGEKMYKIPFISVLKSPENRFRQSLTRCVPDPKGEMTIGQCMLLNDKDVLERKKIDSEPDIVTYLEQRYGGRKKKRSWVLWLLFLTVLFSGLFFLFAKMKRFRKGGDI